MEGRDLAVGLAGGRVAIGVVSLLAPGFVGRMMTGRGGSEGGTRLFARMVGARDLGLGLGLLIALNRGAGAVVAQAGHAATTPRTRGPRLARTSCKCLPGALRSTPWQRVLGPDATTASNHLRSGPSLA
jgi:hypothetical protein